MNQDADFSLFWGGQGAIITSKKEQNQLKTQHSFQLLLVPYKYILLVLIVYV